MYDFANSSFTTIIVTVVFAAYFKGVVVQDGELGTALWGRAIAISMLLVAISAPIFGAIADFSRAKKNFLFYNTYICIIFTALLFWVRKGDVVQGMTFFILANFGFNSANVFYNSLLPQITNSHNIGKISGLGWAVGYVGGLISLILILPLVSSQYFSWIFIFVAVFFAIFSMFIFTHLKEVKRNSKRTNYFRMAFIRISQSFKNIKSFKELLRFVISYLLYNEGIVVVISFAAIYGATRFGMTQKQMVTYFIVMQPSAMIGALGFGFLSDKLSAKSSIMISLIIWVCVVLGAFFSQTIIQYYAVGIVAGFAIGSSQSSSRTMLAKLTPPSKTAEFFGFYAFTGKVAAIIGPLIYGEISRITGDQRYAILSVIVFFIAGGFFLKTVNEKKGILDAKSFSPKFD